MWQGTLITAGLSPFATGPERTQANVRWTPTNERATIWRCPGHWARRTKEERRQLKAAPLHANEGLEAVRENLAHVRGFSSISRATPNERKYHD
jgi:hypothetical protein